MKTEEEAFKVLKNKYKVAIPPYYEQAKKLVAKDITTDAVQPGETKYLILARDKEVEFRTVYTFYQEEKLQTMAVINFYYTFSSDAKKARLERQVVNIKIAPANGKLPKDNYKEITQDLGALMKLPEPTISEGIQGFEKQIKESGKQFKNESVAIVTNSVGLNKNEELAKSISAIYDGGGNLKEIYAEIWDQTE
ncbi:hypothetical protein RV12_GL002198 [Enterococcus quebecensis]|nr:hypothetical protein RV12_GL002198 [Enterococcus quebecensis]